MDRPPVERVAAIGMVHGHTLPLEVGLFALAAITAHASAPADGGRSSPLADALGQLAFKHVGHVRAEQRFVWQP
eukprot:COSAG06_NODE_37785_length_431_cov_0.777108_1_plen_73_part_01